MACLQSSSTKRSNPLAPATAANPAPPVGAATSVIRALAILLAMAAAACGGDKEPLDPGPLTMQMLAGTYLATDNYGAIIFTTTEDGKTTDWLAAGATLEIELTANGKTTGHLFVPGADEDGSDFEADLTGTWTLSGDTIHFAHQADTFVRDTPFLVRGSELRGERTFGEAHVKVTLARH